jgi:hypothetical protein
VPRKAALKNHPKGIRMTKGSRWNLKAQKGREREFARDVARYVYSRRETNRYLQRSNPSKSLTLSH